MAMAMAALLVADSSDDARVPEPDSEAESESPDTI
jgi:hypothetical protein